jgi:hypothetical protein
MTTTIPATNIGSEDNGCAVVTLLSPSAQQKVKDLQSELLQELSGSIWPMPVSSLHSTLCEIIQPKSYADDKATMYAAHHEEYEAALAEVLSEYGPIRVVFNKIEASSQAIVIMGDDDGVFNQIRAKLLKILPFPAETKLPPDVVHSSIARFTKEINLAEVQAVVKQHSILFEEIVTEFQFMYPIWPHLLHYEVVRHYPLAK